MITLYKTPRDIGLKLFREAGRAWNAESMTDMGDNLFNFCVTHVALRDWVMVTLGIHKKDDNFHTEWRKLANGLFGECADIANLSKHLTITKKTGSVSVVRETLIGLGLDGNIVPDSERERDSFQFVRVNQEPVDLLVFFHLICVAWADYFDSNSRLGSSLPPYMESMLSRRR